MLYLLFGTNTHKVADQTNKLVAGLLAKRPLAQVFSFDSDSLNELDLEALVDSKGLFVEKHIVVLRQVVGDGEHRELVIPRLKRMKETENIFIIVEHKLLAEDKKVLAKHADKVEEHVITKKEKESFNVFALSDALCERNKQQLWVLYIQALHEGVEPESIHGTLHWTVRTLLAVVKAKNVEESGQKQYTFNKLKRASFNFTEDELIQMSRDLISIYHEARRGGMEISLALEHWILTV